MEPVRRRAIGGPEGGVLSRRDRQDPGATVFGEYGAFEPRVMPVAAGQPVRPRTLVSGLRLETGIGGIVDVETRHLVHPNDEIDRVTCHMVRHERDEPTLPNVAADAARR